MSETEPGHVASPSVPSRVSRRMELEQRFCLLLNEQLRAKATHRAAHEEMLRIQGAIAELDRLDQVTPRNGDSG